MGAEAPPPRDEPRLVGRSGALAAVDAAVDEPRWTLLEGGPGTGATSLLEHAAARAAARGLTVARWTGDRPGAVADVVLVEEAQRLDAAAVAALDAAPAVVAALRRGPHVHDPAALAALRARARTVKLGPLTPDEVGELTADAAAVHAATGGHPLMAARLAAGGDEDELLEELGHWWTGQIAQLGDRADALAEALLVLGDDAPLWAAAELARQDRDTAAAHADALVAAGLLAASDPMTHAAPLGWRALGHVTPGARRAQAHRQAARLLGQTADGLQRAAAHLLAIAPSGEAWAAEMLRDAARAATDAGRNEDAVACLERALAEPVPRELRTDLLRELGAARDRAGTGDAGEAYRQALRYAGLDERPRIHLELGRSLYGAGHYRDAALEIERGIEAVTGDDDPILVELVAAFVAASRFDRTLEDAAKLHLAPLLERTRHGRTVAERALLAEIALERGIRGFPRATVVGLAMRAWADGLLLEGADPYGIALSQVAAALTWSDAFAESIEVLDATVAHALGEGNAQLEATARYLRAWPRWYRGELAEAEADARAALDAPGWEMYEPSCRAILGHVLVERADVAGAWKALELSDPGPWERTVPYAMLLETRSRLHLAAGDLVRAGADLAEAGALLDSMENASAFCPWRSRLAWIVTLQGDDAQARGLIAAELEQAEAIGTPRATAFALNARGVIAARAGEDGTPDIERAIELFASCGARTEHARGLASLGYVLLRSDRRDEARAPLREAHAAAAAIGAREIEEAAARMLRAAGGRPGPRRTPGGLTPSELRIARLAALGKTNREIAEELVVTPHTVRFHLTGVYRKLGVDSRAAIGPALQDGDGAGA